MSTIAEAWRSHHPYVVNVAYQMLGDIGDAEDVAQESFLRLSKADAGAIEDVRAWLTVVTGRLCLDQVRSARARHERYGDPESSAVALNQPYRQDDPADRVSLDDEVRLALREMLNQLSPGERVSFVLHDVFGVPFDSIAETIGRPVGTCRQLARRARMKFSRTRPNVAEVSTAEHRVVAEEFVAACANGDLRALIEVLDPTVWGVATVLTHPASPPQVNRGPRDVAVNLLQYLGPGVTLVSGPAGRPGLLAFAGGRLFAVIALSVERHRVTMIEAAADPSSRI